MLLQKNPNIRIFNQDNVQFLKQDSYLYDFIYADCIYESEDFTWLDHALRSLKYRGVLVIQTDYHTASRYKVYLDEFSKEFEFVNWLIYMNNWGGVPSNRFAQKHDDILVYSKGKEWTWRPERIQIPKATAGTKLDKKGTGTKTPPSVFYDKVSFSTLSTERVKHGETNIRWQKPEWLMERLLLPFTNVGDEVLDLFMGSGTLGVVAKKHQRNYTGVELDPQIFKLASDRIEA